MILIAVHELRGPKDPSDALKEQLGHIALDISTVAGKPRVREHGKGQRAVAERPPQVPVEYTSEENMEDKLVGSSPTPADEKDTRGFGPLKYVLSLVSIDYEVCR